MASQSIKTVMVVGGSGTIGAPIVSALLANKLYNVSVLSRKESIATFPPEVAVRKVDLAYQPDLLNAFKGQDAVICALNDSAASVQVHLIEAAVKAGVKRFIPSEWGNIELPASVPELEEGITGRLAIIELLKEKSKETTSSGANFHWTAVNCGMLFDWGLRSGFLDITLPPSKTALIWDDGTQTFSATNLNTVGAAVVAVLSTAEVQTRDRFVNIESFPASQNSIVNALQKITGAKWTITNTTASEQLKAAQNCLQYNDFLGAYYRWIRAGVFSGQEKNRLGADNLDNELLGLSKEELQDVVDKVVREQH